MTASVGLGGWRNGRCRAGSHGSAGCGDEQCGHEGNDHSDDGCDAVQCECGYAADGQYQRRCGGSGSGDTVREDERLVVAHCLGGTDTGETIAREPAEQRQGSDSPDDEGEHEQHNRDDDHLARIRRSEVLVPGGPRHTLGW